jgi:hypothetical protein
VQDALAIAQREKDVLRRALDHQTKRAAALEEQLEVFKLTTPEGHSFGVNNFNPPGGKIEMHRRKKV